MNLNQVTLPTLDLLESIGFYEKLGLKLIVKALPRYARFELPEGEATFSIHLVDALPIGNLASVYFEVADLDKKVIDLEAKGVKFNLPPTDQSWLWREARLSDPAGNPIVLYSAGENRKNPPWRI